MRSLLENLRLNLISSVVAGLIGAASALLGAVTQMLTEGKTEFSDIADLVWLVALLSFIVHFGKDAQTYLKMRGE